MFLEEHAVSILYPAYGDCTDSEKGNFYQTTKHHNLQHSILYRLTHTQSWEPGHPRN